MKGILEVYYVRELPKKSKPKIIKYKCVSGYPKWQLIPISLLEILGINLSNSFINKKKCIEYHLALKRIIAQRNQVIWRY